MRIGEQLKHIMDEKGIGFNELLTRIDKIGGRVTPKRLMLLLHGIPATQVEVKWIAHALNIPAWELTEELSQTQRENRKRLKRLLDEASLAHLFPRFWPYVRGSVKYRSSPDKPLDERHLQDLLNLFLDCPDEFDQYGEG